MGKYTQDYERIGKDRYITPMSAVKRLASYFDLKGLEYIEPCTADGAFRDHMASYGAKAVFQSGIAPEIENVTQADALDLHLEFSEMEADAIVTNPPWRRDLLHPMISSFSTAKPTLLLFDANWLNTRQAAQFQDHLVAVFQAGRHRWFEGSELDKGMAPKEDTSWYLFHTPVKGRSPVLILKPFEKGPVSFKEVCTNLKRTGVFMVSGQ